MIIINKATRQQKEKQATIDLGTTKEIILSIKHFTTKLFS